MNKSFNQSMNHLMNFINCKNPIWFKVFSICRMHNTKVGNIFLTFTTSSIIIRLRTELTNKSMNHIIVSQIVIKSANIST